MADNWQLKAVLSANADGMLKTLNAVNKATRSTRKHLIDVANSAGSLASHVGVPLGLIGAAFGAFTVAGIKQAVGSFAELGDQVVKSAQRLGMTTEEYQRFKYMATQSGVSVEGLSASMGRLNKGIALAGSGGNKDLAALFKKAGISVRDANGNLRSAGDMLPEIAELFERNGNAAVQARMGNAIFGKGWQELAPLLQGGKEGITELTERYKMLGLSIDHDALKAGEKFGDQMDDLRQVLGSYGNMVSSKLIPMLSPLVEKTIEWAVANREVVTTKISSFVSDMATSLSKVDWESTLRSIGNFIAGARDMINWIGGVKVALIALAVVMNAQAIMATVALVGSLAKAGIAFMGLAAQAYLAGNASVLSLLRVAVVAIATAGPIGAIGAAFTWMAGLAAGAGGIISGAMGMVGVAIRGVGAAMMANPLGVILGLATAAVLIWQNWDKVRSWFSGFFDWIGKKFQSLLGWALDLAKTAGAIFGGGTGSTLSYAQVTGQKSERPSLVGGGQVRASGSIDINIKGAPPGTTVAQVAGGDIPINTDVGYRSYALD